MTDGSNNHESPAPLEDFSVSGLKGRFRPYLINLSSTLAERGWAERDMEIGYLASALKRPHEHGDECVLSQGPDPIRTASVQDTLARRFREIEDRDGPEKVAETAYFARYADRLDDSRLSLLSKRLLAANKLAIENILDDNPNIRALMEEYGRKHQAKSR